MCSSIRTPNRSPIRLWLMKHSTMFLSVVDVVVVAVCGGCGEWIFMLRKEDDNGDL